ncbi:hypothetical protein ACFOLA_11280 [Salinicoccus hispanicus]|uniref:Uncharacterized protein n=1 Tax=Salinicoccus hispanicus TaxID=157225 RepID=A0A6N8TYL7_9STAP|nr:hypothetical protein [Salinicoccus hispanicus]MXQ50944.1 hypothetical protein [Salinicoccus hispanicus]
MKEQIYFLKIVRYFFLILFIAAIGMGTYHLFVYEQSESYYGTSRNAYVGGDAYNYIINTTRATAYYVAGFGSLIVVFLNEILITILSRTIQEHSNDILDQLDSGDRITEIRNGLN